jgi:hypothetical protein
MIEPNEVIAQRALHAGGIKLLVSIAKPIQDEEDFRCRYSLVGDEGIQKTGYAIGMDAVQALQLAMKKIKVDLASIEEKIGMPFSWLDDEPGVSGFGC